MKKALLALSAVALSASALAQGTTGGTILFRTLQVQNAAGTANYNVPLYQSSGDNVQNGVSVANENSTVGAGSAAGGITIGLFTSGSTTPFFTSTLGTSGTQTPYAVNPATATIAVPGTLPGQTVPLTIRAWSTTAGSYAAAQTAVNAQWREWTFTTRPLGGDTGTGTPTTPPTMTGWGPENGAGYELNMTVPEPSTIALGVLGIGAVALMRRRK